MSVDVMGKLERIRQFSHWKTPSRNLSCFLFYVFSKLCPLIGHVSTKKFWLLLYNYFMVDVQKGWHLSLPMIFKSYLTPLVLHEWREAARVFVRSLSPFSSFSYFFQCSVFFLSVLSLYPLYICYPKYIYFKCAMCWLIIHVLYSLWNLETSSAFISVLTQLWLTMGNL